MADTTPYSPPQEPGRWRAIALAAAVHAALIAFLWIGIRWQSETPVAVEAEVWDMQAKEAAPRQVAPPPEPEPVRQPEPKPQPKPEVKASEEKPDIALEQERKKKEKAKREEEERLARLKEEKAQAEKDKKELAKKEKQLALEKEKALLEKQKAEALVKKEKAEADKKRLRNEQDAKLLAKMREDDLKRMTDAAGAVAGSGGTGTAAKSQGMRGDPSYAAKIAAKIKSNTQYPVPPDLQGNPAVEYDVQLFPDGSLRGAPRKVKSSGIPAFDEAVRRAIELSAPFPADKSGSVPAAFPVIHKPKEQ
ncbi:cell envelope integrity protein TolA [Janthinobacterium sp. 17J80-10]|uniref:cell envelope integrity protein TolA n=1 Tax=Janthinobacterium sp. 17J80-10 TaxID=2497863 RepID=UPI00100555BE|nr:cell envelope integrity protein TolA [Janthinobacterium sp. 17J80-10]QAU35261.1 cell envelope integrity protein TolA [Janthinobacterium sp. 17J80-10]